MIYLVDTRSETWWIDVTTISGTVAPGETFVDTVHFNTHDPSPQSTYTANILIHNNSIDPLVTIPVTMHVILGGAIEGIVSEVDKGPIEHALVKADEWVAITNESGYYYLEIPPGIYDVIANASGYNPDTVFAVEVVTTTQVNFALTHPEIEVTPTSYEIELLVETTYDTTMTISNFGNGPLDFTISVSEDAKFLKSIEISPGGISYSQGALHRETDPIQRGELQLVLNSQNGELDPLQGFTPLSSGEDTLHYDGDNYSAIGINGGGSFEGAIRLTPTELNPYNGWDIVSVLLYYYTGDGTGTIKIYGPGTPSSPGALITSEPFSVSQGWWRIDLSSPVTINALPEIWVSLALSNASGDYPLGVDAGPAVDGKGDWICIDETWAELQDYGVDCNCNIRAIVVPPPLWLSVTPESGTIPAFQSLDVTLHFDTNGLTPDSTYNTNILIQNNSADSLVTIPVTLNVTPYGIDDPDPQVPVVFALGHNYPNPISSGSESAYGGKGGKSQTTISYTLPKPCKVSLKIYNINFKI